MECAWIENKMKMRAFTIMYIIHFVSLEFYLCMFKFYESSRIDMFMHLKHFKLLHMQSRMCGIRLWIRCKCIYWKPMCFSNRFSDGGIKLSWEMQQLKSLSAKSLQNIFFMHLSSECQCVNLIFHRLE